MSTPPRPGQLALVDAAAAVRLRRLDIAADARCALPW